MWVDLMTLARVATTESADGRMLHVSRSARLGLGFGRT
jgi:hypothetical protein